MKSPRLETLRRGTFFVLLLCVLLFLSMAVMIPNCWTLWADKKWIGERIKKTHTVEQWQKLTLDAADEIAISQYSFNILLAILMFALAVVVIFLGCSLSMMAGLKHELFQIGRPDDILGPPPPAAKSPEEY